MRENIYFDPTFMERLFHKGAENETLEYICNELRKTFHEEAPDRDAVKAFLTKGEYDPEVLTEDYLDVINMSLLEFNQVLLVEMRHMFMFQYLKRHGVVDTMSEYLDLQYPDKEA